MERKYLVVALIAFAVLIMAGCALLSPQQQNPGETGPNVNGVEPPQIVVPDINDSEGDFPLPA
jgi:hypothetical protein